MLLSLGLRNLSAQTPNIGDLPNDNDIKQQGLYPWLKDEFELAHVGGVGHLHRNNRWWYRNAANDLLNPSSPPSTVKPPIERAVTVSQPITMMMTPLTYHEPITRTMTHEDVSILTKEKILIDTKVVMITKVIPTTIMTVSVNHDTVTSFMPVPEKTLNITNLVTHTELSHINDQLANLAASIEARRCNVVKTITKVIKSFCPVSRITKTLTQESTKYLTIMTSTDLNSVTVLSYVAAGLSHCTTLANYYHGTNWQAKKYSRFDWEPPKNYRYDHREHNSQHNYRKKSISRNYRHNRIYHSNKASRRADSQIDEQNQVKNSQNSSRNISHIKSPKQRDFWKNPHDNQHTITKNSRLHTSKEVKLSPMSHMGYKNKDHNVAHPETTAERSSRIESYNTQRKQYNSKIDNIHQSKHNREKLYKKDTRKTRKAVYRRPNGSNSRHRDHTTIINKKLEPEFYPDRRSKTSSERTFSREHDDVNHTADLEDHKAKDCEEDEFCSDITRNWSTHYHQPRESMISSNKYKDSKLISNTNRMATSSSDQENNKGHKIDRKSKSHNKVKRIKTFISDPKPRDQITSDRRESMASKIDRVYRINESETSNKDKRSKSIGDSNKTVESKDDEDETNPSSNFIKNDRVNTDQSIKKNENLKKTDVWRDIPFLPLNYVITPAVEDV